uniref:Disease resistance R13L4/SHOC-2-like LRR domain-containing protein n=1 Tax=Solanum lycopersicum TaxID=4081 RepID=K4BNL6_SOLLC
MLRFDSFPLVITKLFHLRYLHVERLSMNIPESISELLNLQTLISSCSPLFRMTLPKKIWLMKNLKYISLGRNTYLPSPRINKNLVTVMPNLEKFFGLCYSSCTNEVFSSIPNLKILTIHVPLTFKEEIIPYRFLDMSSLIKLEAFKLFWDKNWENPIKTFVFPTSLRRLTLTFCSKFIWEEISSTFIMLPNLEKLKLKYCGADDDAWIMSDKDIFKSLKLLLLSHLNLKRWEASSDNFPNLKRLVLKKCPDLQEIPTDFGEICTLESIELHDCSATSEVSARNIEQEQEDMENNILKGIEASFETCWILFYVFSHKRNKASCLLLTSKRILKEFPLIKMVTLLIRSILRATSEYFLNVLEKSSYKSGIDIEKIKSLEEKIIVVASEAEYVVETNISEIIKGDSWTFGILQHQDMLPVVEKMDNTKKQVMEILSHDDADQILELTGDFLIGASSMSDPMLSDQLKDDIVQGLDGDLKIIDK